MDAFVLISSLIFFLFLFSLHLMLYCKLGMQPQALPRTAMIRSWAQALAVSRKTLPVLTLPAGVSRHKSFLPVADSLDELAQVGPPLVGQVGSPSLEASAQQRVGVRIGKGLVLADTQQHLCFGDSPQVSPADALLTSRC